MEKHTEQLEHLAEIRSLMERSSRFISLSGMSGIVAGLAALAGAAAAYWYFDYNVLNNNAYMFDTSGNIRPSFVKFVLLDGITVLTFAIGSAFYFTNRRAKKEGHQIWDKVAQRLFINMSIPLVTGGIFTLLLLYHGLGYLMAPATLVFYGLALLNASKHTLDDIRYLGICEIVLGLLASFFVGYGLLFWTIGFGLLHIIYGISMYFKYEK